METDVIQNGFFVRVERVSNILNAILTFQGITTLLIILVVLALTVFFLQSFYRMRLLVSSASQGKKNMSFVGVLSALSDAFGKLFHNIFILLPIFAGILLILLSVKWVLDITGSINRFVEREKRIHELTVAIKYMEQSEKVFDVRILSVDNGITKLRINYDASDPDDSSVPVVEWRKDLSIEGTDIYFDCIVLNFSYSEITSGRQKNIAIPYRIFSNVVPAAKGIYLHETSAEIPEEDDYGFIPPVYRQRLMQLLTDEAFSRDMGVRSVNGSAVHRYVYTGQRFKVKIENSGGIRFEL
jgi:hypothetical protein